MYKKCLIILGLLFCNQIKTKAKFPDGFGKNLLEVCGPAIFTAGLYGFITKQHPANEPSARNGAISKNLLFLCIGGTIIYSTHTHPTQSLLQLFGLSGLEKIGIGIEKLRYILKKEVNTNDCKTLSYDSGKEIAIGSLIALTTAGIMLYNRTKK